MYTYNEDRKAGEKLNLKLLTSNMYIVQNMLIQSCYDVTQIVGLEDGQMLCGHQTLATFETIVMNTFQLPSGKLWGKS